MASIQGTMFDIVSQYLMKNCTQFPQINHLRIII